MANKLARRPSVFQEDGVRETLRQYKDFVRQLYLEDDVPWVVGYSGGKDSTATLQLVWLAISELDEAKRPQADSRHQHGYPRRESHRCGLGHALPRQDQCGGRVRVTSICRPPPDARGRGHLLGQSDREGLSGTPAQVPLVHGTVEDQALEPVHPQRRAAGTGRRSWYSAPGRPRAPSGPPR